MVWQIHTFLVKGPYPQYAPKKRNHWTTHGIKQLAMLYTYTMHLPQIFYSWCLQ